MARAASSALSAFLVVLSMVLSACQLIPDQLATYDYAQPVPAGEQKDDSWFDDSAIIGHSLMEGFESFSKLDSDPHFFSNTGLSAARAVTYDQFELPDGGTGTLETGLSQREFSKVYIMLGVNEITISQEKFKENMTTVLQLVRDSQPEGTPIYILNLTPTTREKSDSSDFDLANVQRLNEALAELCEEQQCYLVDLYTCFADEEGYLPTEISTDGVHLKAPQYRVMADYILSHTVD